MADHLLPGESIYTERPGVLVLTGWHGRSEVPVVVIGDTPKRYRVRLLADTRLPSRRRGTTGDEVLVPKTAVRLDDDRARAAQGGRDRG